MLRGRNYQLSILFPYSVSSVDPVGGVWLDYNRNGLFEASEFTLATTTRDPTLGYGGRTLAIPANAPLGQVTMRVRTTNTNLFTFDGTKGCANLTSGETEDYVLTIADECPLPAPDILFNGALAGPAPAPGGSLILRSLRTLPAGTTLRWTGPNGFTSSAAQPTLSNLSSAHTGYYFLTVQSGTCQLTTARYLNVGTTTATASAQEALAVSLYPNPSPGRSTLRLEGPMEPSATVIVLNSLGQPVWQATTRTLPGATEIPLDLSGQPRGLYIVLVKTTRGTAYRKWVVE